jgi:2-isopropylmalate synthase
VSWTSSYFDVCGYKVTSERLHDGSARVWASVEVRIDNECVHGSSEGVGPIHALDNALRRCLRREFPEVENVRLSDYRVSVVNAADATAAQVRVLIQATDGETSWDAGCVSENIVDASFEALCASAVMGILRARVVTGSVAV